jgi:predicted nucleic acid-binding protein
VRIFLDANILFSAAKSDGAVRELLELLRKAGHVLCADLYVITEARRNLEAKSEAGVAVFEAMLRQIEVVPFRHHQLSAKRAASLPEKDRPVLAAALGEGCDALVTGDRRHFGKLYGQTIDGLAVHSPSSLAEALLGASCDAW